MELDGEQLSVRPALESEGLRFLHIIASTESTVHAVLSERWPPSLRAQRQEERHVERWQLKPLVNRTLP
ncbi:hypothetical protein D623_10019044 [Myotis brandtii]|uniref:Uncharacterized protein n=1 Tax=Myotis brandtii TaxID=109478 RepID=S7PZS0_MYOBR|nr:hypothetical protein D623_10019044 [Myotis brandtii]